MHVTIILDSGGFLIDEKSADAHLDVGYFETPGPHDIEVSEDNKPTQAVSGSKLGTLNRTIDVQHLAADGSVKTGVNQSESFKNDILKKNELYPVDSPDFIASEYDCILRFHSGDFESSDVRPRDFEEHRVSDDAYTGNTRQTRAIANDVLVQFDLGDGEELRLRRKGEPDLWSSSSVGRGARQVVVKLLTDDSLDTKYFGKALNHKGTLYHRPNPDPPPMNGNDPGAGGHGG